MRVAIVEFRPEERGPLVTWHACWLADDGYETSVFATRSEAVDYCHRRWGMEPTVIGPAAAPGEGDR